LPHPISLTLSHASSSLRLIVIGVLFTAHAAVAGRFDLPKEGPQISIQIPDGWQPELDGDKVTAHPPSNSKIMISVFALPKAENMNDAFAIATKQFSASYSDVKIGKLAEQKQAGFTFYGGQGEGEKDGFELIVAVAAFTSDGKHFFGLAWTRDEAAGDVYIQDINKALASIQPFKEVPKPAK
jgi:hypothetical protein